MRVKPGELRFVVRKIEGFPIRAHAPRAKLSPNHMPLLSVSVLDRAYNCEEVARFNEEDVRTAPGRTKAMVREAIRNRALGLAAQLNDGQSPEDEGCIWRGTGTLRGGTHSGYTGGCRCSVCRDGHARYKRERRHKRRKP